MKSNILVLVHFVFLVYCMSSCGTATKEPELKPQKDTIEVNGVSFNMVHVTGGDFIMGATKEQQDDYQMDETPAHTVVVSSFLIGETEVTQELWQAVMGNNPSHLSGSKHPVENISWDNCQFFIERLNELTGMNFRLPTEEEWEYAARGGKQNCGSGSIWDLLMRGKLNNKYAGSSNLDEVGWYDDNVKAIGSYGPQDVATKAPNELGLYDMSGNVCEWCQSWKCEYNTSSSMPKSISMPYRVFRGGSSYDSSSSCRVSSRDSFYPNCPMERVGLRLAL